jgi:hypothetical protein
MKKLTFILITLALFINVFADPIGLVVSLQGSASAVDEAGASRTLAMQSDVFLNDTVTTGADSKLQILLNDDSIFSQGEQSEMTIDEYIYNPAQASDNAFGVRLGKGLFRTVTGKITDLNPDRFTVKTSRATIGIRGCDLGFNITPSEDNISIMAIPVGKKIFIDPIQGDESVTIETPTVVIVDDQGNIETRPLTSQDRAAIQQGTTPERSSENSDQESSDTSGEVSGTTDDSDSTADDDGESGVLDTGTITQDTNQDAGQELTERLLTESEVDQIIANSTLYNLSGSGTASAIINTFNNGMPIGTYNVSGPASVSMSIGQGLAQYSTQIGRLENGSGQWLEFDTFPIDFSGHTGDLAVNDVSDIHALSMHADGMWDESHLTIAEADGELYGTGGDSAPTAARLVDGFLVLENGSASAEVDFSTSKINLN